VAAVQSRLEGLGLDRPRITAEVQPYSISHDVTNGEWVTKDCQSCHDDDSRLNRSIQLAAYLPGGVLPAVAPDAGLTLSGELEVEPSGELVYRPNTGAEGLYILGHDRVGWVDWLGALAFVVTLVGVTAHGGLRVAASLRAPQPEPALKPVYMYTVYERLWHWLQTAAIMALIFTGLIIHRPEMFGMFDFGYTVLVHNALGFILLINAFLAAFYHLASGEIKQFLPQPRGFFDQAIAQAIFYLRGIFKGAAHPFEKNPQKKLNPLQQVTYFGILNVLLPLQIVTGIMIWGAQRWPDVANALGGLPFLAPFHTLVAWLFAAFIVMHVYLTTTAHTPLAGIRAMIVGWDEVEVHGEA
jgi:thiosulfate reductase cytochrome b subunit